MNTTVINLDSVNLYDLFFFFMPAGSCCVYRNRRFSIFSILLNGSAYFWPQIRIIKCYDEENRSNRIHFCLTFIFLLPYSGYNMMESKDILRISYLALTGRGVTNSHAGTVYIVTVSSFPVPNLSSPVSFVFNNYSTYTLHNNIHRSHNGLY